MTGAFVAHFLACHQFAGTRHATRKAMTMQNGEPATQCLVSSLEKVFERHINTLVQVSCLQCSLHDHHVTGWYRSHLGRHNAD